MASDRVRRNFNKPCVILDTSAVLTPFEFSVDMEKELFRLLGRYELCIPQCVLDELEVLYERDNSATSKHAKTALSWIQRFTVVPTTNRGDDGVIEAAQQYHATVVTNDRELRGRLKKLHIPMITLRQKQYLMKVE